MKIKEIDSLHGPSDLVNDCLDVLVTLENEENDALYMVEVTIPQFLSTHMKRAKSDFLPVGYP